MIHTPGPWTIEDLSEDGLYVTVGPPTGTLIAQINPTQALGLDSEDLPQANSHLIAAAPELLEALKDVVNSVQYTEGMEYIDYPNLIEVIAKAEGKDT